jgi:hypothetical protein
MSQNIGTLITSTIRPNDSLDKISVIFANEAKGGHHAYETYADMTTAQVKFPDRFIFGMLGTVYNDPTSAYNATYTLKYGKYDTDSANPLNWETFSGGEDYDEWQNSVISITSSIPAVNVTGDRYLIIGSTGGTSFTASENTWLNHEDNIAEYDSTVPTWNFFIPFEGVTVRVDDQKGVMYKYTGSYSYGGRWTKEYINQVYNLTASSINGNDYVASGDVYSYNNSVFYVNFMTASSGSDDATININNLGTASIRKITGNNLLSIAANDFNTTVIYQLIYDGTYFQTPILSSVNQIGPAENGGSTYTGGLYTDFTSTTEIGTPIDRFNKILSALVPPSAPNLQSINGFAALLTSSRLSFPISGDGRTNYYNPATNSSYGNVSVDGQWSASALSSGYRRLGAYAATSSNTNNITLYGILNYNIAADSGIPTPAYVANSIGNGYSGNLFLVINGLTVSTVSLTASYGATNSTIGLSRPGLSMSAATASKFPSGVPFDTFYNRTGSWYIPASSMYGPFTYNSSIGMTANQYGLTRGYNYVTVTQVTPTNTYSLAKVEFLLDDDVAAISVNNTYAGGAFANITGGATKSLSGITYFTTFTQLTYRYILYGAYGGVYSDNANAITITDNTPAGTGTPAPSVLLSTTMAISGIGNTSSNYLGADMIRTYNINSTPFRRINDSLNVYVSRVLKPLINTGSQSFTPATGASASAYGIVFDNVTSAATDLFEDFNDEGRRLATNAYNVYSVIATNLYNRNNSLLTVNTDSLQVYNGRIQYPANINFATIGSNTVDYVVNYNYGNTDLVYSSCTGVRYYYRYFYNTSVNSSQFGIAISGSGTLTASSANFSSLSNTGNFAIQIKLPGAAAAVSGWLDISRTTAGLLTADNTGIYNGSGVGPIPPGTLPNLSGTAFALSIGSLNTSSSGGYVVLRITAPSKWTGNVDAITFTYY